MMILSSLQLIVLLVIDRTIYAILPFYVTNVPLLEQCSSTARITQLNTLNPSQMLCFDQKQRQISITIEYICQSNLFKNIWTLKTEKNSTTGWPMKMQVLTVYGTSTSYTLYQVITGSNRAKETIEETSFQFQSSHNPLTTYFWIADSGPYCRLKNSVPNDICTAKKGQRFALKPTQFVCIYTKQNYAVQNSADRNKLNTFIDGNFKITGNIGTKNSTTSGSSSGNTIAQENGSESEIGAQAKGNQSFFEKYKTYLMIGGGVMGVIVVVGVLTVVLRRPSTSPNGQARKSAVSMESAGTVD